MALDKKSVQTVKQDSSNTFEISAQENKISPFPRLFSGLTGQQLGKLKRNTGTTHFFGRASRRAKEESTQRSIGGEKRGFAKRTRESRTSEKGKAPRRISRSHKLIASPTPSGKYCKIHTLAGSSPVSDCEPSANRKASISSKDGIHRSGKQQLLVVDGTSGKVTSILRHHVCNKCTIWSLFNQKRVMGLRKERQTWLRKTKPVRSQQLVLLDKKKVSLANTCKPAPCEKSVKKGNTSPQVNTENTINKMNGTENETVQSQLIFDEIDSIETAALSGSAIPSSHGGQFSCRLSSQENTTASTSHFSTDESQSIGESDSYSAENGKFFPREVIFDETDSVEVSAISQPPSSCYLSHWCCGNTFIPRETAADSGFVEKVGQIDDEPSAGRRKTSNLQPKLETCGSSDNLQNANDAPKANVAEVANSPWNEFSIVALNESTSESQDAIEYTLSQSVGSYFTSFFNDSLCEELSPSFQKEFAEKTTSSTVSIPVTDTHAEDRVSSPRADGALAESKAKRKRKISYFKRRWLTMNAMANVFLALPVENASHGGQCASNNGAASCEKEDLAQKSQEGETRSVLFETGEMHDKKEDSLVDHELGGSDRSRVMPQEKVQAPTTSQSQIEDRVVGSSTGDLGELGGGLSYRLYGKGVKFTNVMRRSRRSQSSERCGRLVVPIVNALSIPEETQMINDTPLTLDSSLKKQDAQPKNQFESPKQKEVHEHTLTATCIKCARGMESAVSGPGKTSGLGALIKNLKNPLSHVRFSKARANPESGLSDLALIDVSKVAESDLPDAKNAGSRSTSSDRKSYDRIYCGERAESGERHAYRVRTSNAESSSNVLSVCTSSFSPSVRSENDRTARCSNVEYKERKLNYSSPKPHFSDDQIKRLQHILKDFAANRNDPYVSRSNKLRSTTQEKNALPKVQESTAVEGLGHDITSDFGQEQQRLLDANQLGDVDVAACVTTAVDIEDDVEATLQVESSIPNSAIAHCNPVGSFLNKSVKELSDDETAAFQQAIANHKVSTSRDSSVKRRARRFGIEESELFSNVEATHLRQSTIKISSSKATESEDVESISRSKRLPVMQSVASLSSKNHETGVNNCGVCESSCVLVPLADETNCGKRSAPLEGRGANQKYAEGSSLNEPQAACVAGDKIDYEDGAQPVTHAFDRRNNAPTHMSKCNSLDAHSLKRTLDRIGAIMNRSKSGSLSSPKKDRSGDQELHALVSSLPESYLQKLRSGIDQKLKASDDGIGEAKVRLDDPNEKASSESFVERSDHTIASDDDAPTISSFTLEEDSEGAVSSLTVSIEGEEQIHGISSTAQKNLKSLSLVLVQEKESFADGKGNKKERLLELTSTFTIAQLHELENILKSMNDAQEGGNVKTTPFTKDACIKTISFSESDIYADLESLMSLSRDQDVKQFSPWKMGDTAAAEESDARGEMIASRDNNVAIHNESESLALISSLSSTGFSRADASRQSTPKKKGKVNKLLNIVGWSKKQSNKSDCDEAHDVQDEADGLDDKDGVTNIHLSEVALTFTLDELNVLNNLIQNSILGRKTDDKGRLYHCRRFGGSQMSDVMVASE